MVRYEVGGPKTKHIQRESHFDKTFYEQKYP